MVLAPRLLPFSGARGKRDRLEHGMQGDPATQKLHALGETLQPFASCSFPNATVKAQKLRIMSSLLEM
jgi:hypothetical protein